MFQEAALGRKRLELTSAQNPGPSFSDIALVPPITKKEECILHSGAETGSPV
jgi:hypothetical protein